MITKYDDCHSLANTSLLLFQADSALWSSFSMEVALRKLLEQEQHCNILCPVSSARCHVFLPFVSDLLFPGSGPFPLCLCFVLQQSTHRIVQLCLPLTCWVCQHHFLASNLTWGCRTRGLPVALHEGIYSIDYLA